MCSGKSVNRYFPVPIDLDVVGKKLNQRKCKNQQKVNTDVILCGGKSHPGVVVVLDQAVALDGYHGSSKSAPFCRGREQSKGERERGAERGIE